VTHPERGTALLDRLAEELGDVAVIEQTPLQDGRNMTMMLGPSKSVISGEAEGSKPSGGRRQAFTLRWRALTGRRQASGR